jgi:hypothetical protein
MAPRKKIHTPAEKIEVARRLTLAAGRTTAGGDPDDLANLCRLRATIEEAIDTAVVGIRESGYSWTALGEVLGITRQGAFQRYGPRVGGARFTPEEVQP